MHKDIYDAEIKARLPLWLRKALESIARREDLELSDIVRRALKDYAIKSSPATQLAA